MNKYFSKCWNFNINDDLINVQYPYEMAEVELKNAFCNLNETREFEVIVTGKGDYYEIATKNNKLVITGGETGVLYGAYRLISILRQDILTNEINICESPKFKLRIINHWDNLDGSIERGYSGNSIFFKNDTLDYDESRVKNYARLLASVGINTLSINNVNVFRAAVDLITESKLGSLAKIADIFRVFGIKLLISINYASPIILDELDTADPNDAKVRTWWKNRMELVYKYIPDLAGVIVKADSENQPGPYTYGATHVDGANLFAESLKPFNGIVFWRCFVYNCKQSWKDITTDRPKAAYDTYSPLDGKFDDNVSLQIKFGPYDFQVREAISPLLGSMSKTDQVLELQLAQEYTGHQIDLYYLATQWKEIFEFDTKKHENSRIIDFAGNKISSICAVSNLGDGYFWTGNFLAQANLFAYGKMAWNPEITPEEIAREWCSLSFELEKESLILVENMLLRSRNIYESYTAPLGLCWLVKRGLHYGPGPMDYEFSEWGTYHKADCTAVGVDRTSSGTGYTSQYSEEVCRMYDNIETCPEELLLFFHRVPYNYKLKNGTSLIQHIYDTRFKGVSDTLQLIEEWILLKDKLPSDIYENVLERFNMQHKNSCEWRDEINTFFYRLSGIEDEKNRKIYK
jgi:alpha-glucuronidase